jgi:hypothetical protein
MRTGPDTSERRCERTPRPFSTGAIWILVGIASVAFLGSAAVPAAVAATVEASAEGTLSIDTDPAGALAYVDGGAARIDAGERGWGGCRPGTTASVS